MSDRTTNERICPQCGVKTTALTCPQHDIPTLARITGSVDTVQTGEIIGRRYRVDRLLGKGGFGAVFRATHVVTQQELVLKVLKPNLSDDETQVKRFLQEARTASKLSHPNTVRVYDFGQTDAGHLYLAMELLHGQELGQVLLDEGILAPERAIHIAIGVLKSLAEAHQAGLVHRDLKPDNIFLCKVHGEDDFVKVIDFGIAKPIEQGDDGGLTRTGFTVGTPKYMSPEQVLNKGVEGRSDLYALGVILYQCLSGELPLSGPSPVETMMAHVQQEPAALSLVCPQELPPGLEAVVMRALRKQPNQRFVDAEDMRAALEEVQESAGLTTGRKARSAKLRAVTPADVERTTAQQVRPDPVQTPAPSLTLVRNEPSARNETPNTEDGLDATLQNANPRPRAPTQPSTAVVPLATLKDARVPANHLDATLDVAKPQIARPQAKTRTSAAAPIAAVVVVLALAVAGWFVLAGKSAPVAAPPPPALAVERPPETAASSAAKLLSDDASTAAETDLAPAVHACRPKGAVDIAVLVDGKGHATDVQFARRSAEGNVASCITSAVRKYRFPEADTALRQASLRFAVAAAPVAPTTEAAPAAPAAASEPSAEAPKAASKVRKAAPKANVAKPNGDEAL